MNSSSTDTLFLLLVVFFTGLGDQPWQCTSISSYSLISGICLCFWTLKSACFSLVLLGCLSISACAVCFVLPVLSPYRQAGSKSVVRSTASCGGRFTAVAHFPPWWGLEVRTLFLLASEFPWALSLLAGDRETFFTVAFLIMRVKTEKSEVKHLWFCLSLRNPGELPLLDLRGKNSGCSVIPNVNSLEMRSSC